MESIKKNFKCTKLIIKRPVADSNTYEQGEEKNEEIKMTELSKHLNSVDLDFIKPPVPLPVEGEVWEEKNPKYTRFERSKSIKVLKVFLRDHAFKVLILFEYLPHRGFVDSQPHELSCKQFLQDYKMKKQI